MCAALLAGALIAIVAPLAEAGERDVPFWTLGVMLAAIPMIKLFLRWEARLAFAGGDPILPPILLQGPGLLGRLSHTSAHPDAASVVRRFKITSCLAE